MATPQRRRNREVPRRYFYLFIGLGLVFVAQMVWWIVFYIDTIGDDMQPRHLRMLILEGAFFVVLILIGLVIIYRVLRQQVIQRQHFRDFFAGFSHELKTPIAAMKLQTETILSLDLPKEKRDKLLGNMLEDLERLELTIENILDVFRIEAGRLRIDTRPVLLDPWLEETIESHARAFAEVRLHIDFELRAGAHVDIDERYFQTVLANIIQNSVRYAAGDPRLSVRSARQGGKVELRFSDSGVGFTPEDSERIFEKYYRIDGENGQKHKGAGLGLFLSRQIVIAHGGSIRAESRGEGAGAEFVITLPIAKNDEPGQDTDR